MTTIGKEDLERINAYTRRPLTEADVYVFSLTLCDNEIDRDGERFTTDALAGLAPLFLGKTGIFDHNAKSGNQNARIFQTWVETDSARATSVGEPYAMLRAKAYMVRTNDNRSLIDEIDGGIKKEVSVGCSMGSATCSICGAERHGAGCEHRAGKIYGNERCHIILDDPQDAYEWSFVAVPAQRNAGVTKAFAKEAFDVNELMDYIKSAEKGVQLSAQQVQQLKSHLRALEQAQTDAAAYRAHLLAQIEKYLLLAMPNVKTGCFLQGCRGMSAEDLQGLKDSLKAQAANALPVLQLKHADDAADKTDNRAYCI